MLTRFSTALAVALLGSQAGAATYTIYDSTTAGKADFDATVGAAGGTVTESQWTGLSGGTSIDFGDYTLTSNDGGSLFPTSYGSLSGEVVDISPAGGGSGPRTDPADYLISGVTLTFDEAINSIGFEVGDWATCCQNPTSDLYIAFDGGAPLLVATSDDFTDGQLGPNGEFEAYVAAFDDSGSFNSISFWGNGIGEYLVFGGTVSYALIDEGSLPPPSPVPLPAAGWMLAAALGGMGASRLRRR